MEIKVRLRKLASCNGKYKSYAITLPREVLENFPQMKKRKYLKLTTDVIGNLVIKV